MVGSVGIHGVCGGCGCGVWEGVVYVAECVCACIYAYVVVGAKLGFVGCEAPPPRCIASASSDSRLLGHL